MRFAIALLTIICIASVIGTVVQQHQPPVNYVNQFGPFWAEVFGRLGLYAVYSAGWFLLILAFLVISTSLCIARNTPKILADLTHHQGRHPRERAARPSTTRRAARWRWPRGRRWRASPRCWPGSGWSGKRAGARATA